MIFNIPFGFVVRVLKLKLDFELIMIICLFESLRERNY